QGYEHGNCHGRTRQESPAVGAIERALLLRNSRLYGGYLCVAEAVMRKRSHGVPPDVMRWRGDITRRLFRWLRTDRVVHHSAHGSQRSTETSPLAMPRTRSFVGSVSFQS